MRTIKTMVSVFIVFVFLAASLAPMCNGSDDWNGNGSSYVCELTYNGKTTQYETVTDAVNDWDENGSGECVLKIYETSAPISEAPIHITQKKNVEDRTLLIEGEGKVVMKCPTNPGSDVDYPCVFFITAQSDFTQTPSLTFRNITFDMTHMTRECYGIYSYGTEGQRYIRGIFVDSCTFVGNKDCSCIGVKTRANGSADFTMYNCVGKDLHSLFNGYCFKKYNDDYGLIVTGCISTNGKSFVNNQAGEHNTYIGDCVAEFSGDATDSYGIRTGGSNLYMENVRLKYMGDYGTDFNAFVAVKNNNVKEMSLTNCVFSGFDDVTDSLEKNNNKKDIYTYDSLTINKLTIDGEEKSLVSGRYYNFPRYTVSVEQVAGGSATVSDGHYSEESLKVMKGTELTLNHKPDNGYVFKEWNITSEIKLNALYEFTMIGENVTATPSFENVGRITHTVKVVQADKGGTVSPSNNVEDGSDFVFIAKADDNYRVSCVWINGENVGAVSMYTIRNITADVTIEVKFEDAPGTTTKISDDSKFITETVTSACDVGTETVSKITDADANVINQVSVYDLILDVVTTATKTESERYVQLNDTIESKITVASVVKEKTAEVVASQTYLKVANEQIAWMQKETEIDTAPIYNMNIHSDEPYDKITACFGKDIVDQINKKNGQIAISSSDEGKCSHASVVLDRDAVKDLFSNPDKQGFSELYLTVGQSETEELTPEQRAAVGDNTVVFAKLVLVDEKGNELNISQLGGKAKISIEHEFESENPVFFIYHVASDGAMEKMEDATYNAYTKTISFKTSHFSQFVIMEEEVDPVIVHGSDDAIVLLIFSASFMIIGICLALFLMIRRRTEDY